MATINAIEKRIKRKLAHNGLRLLKAKNERVRLDVGDYYIVDVQTGGANETHVDIEGLAQELGVMKPGEVME